MSEEYREDDYDEALDEEDEIRRLILEAEENEIWIEEPGEADEDIPGAGGN